MKTSSLSILVVIFIMLSSCNKKENVVTPDSREDVTLMQDFADDDSQINSSTRIRVGNMTFEQFKGALKAIHLERSNMDILKRSNRFIISSGPLDGFVPSPCFPTGLTGQDSIAFCKQEWYWECERFCDQKFYDDISELETDEQSAEQNLQLALLRCNNEPPGIWRESCITIAENEYQEAMDEIDGRYQIISQHWMACSDQCAANFLR